MELPSIITNQERAKAALRKAAGGLDRLNRFYLMSGVAWAITEIERGKKVTPGPELKQHKPFMTGRSIIHRLA
jgi:hypothetical protein